MRVPVGAFAWIELYLLARAASVGSPIRRATPRTELDFVLAAHECAASWNLDRDRVHASRRNAPAKATTSSAIFERALIGSPFLTTTASTTRNGWSPARCATRAASRLERASKTKKQISSSGMWMAPSKRSACSAARLLLGCRASPSLARSALSGAVTGEVGLDEIARHRSDATVDTDAAETSERLNFALACGRADGRAPSVSAHRAWRRCG